MFHGVAVDSGDAAHSSGWMRAEIFFKELERIRAIRITCRRCAKNISMKCETSLFIKNALICFDSLLSPSQRQQTNINKL